MNTSLQIFLITCLLFFLCIVFAFIAKKRLNLKYALVWIIADVAMITITLAPWLVDAVGQFIGIATPVNTVFLFGGMFMMLILMILTFIVSHLNNSVYRMAQTIAILDKQVRAIQSTQEEKE